MKHGRGNLIWIDKSTYDGDFFQNNIHGIGEYVWADGRILNGEWVDNKMEG